MYYTGRGSLLIPLHTPLYSLALFAGSLGPSRLVATDDYLLLSIAAHAHRLLARQSTLDCTTIMGRSRSPCEFIMHAKNLIRGDTTVIGHAHRLNGSALAAISALTHRYNTRIVMSRDVPGSKILRT